ncbi:MAG: spermidine/putrescine ABC transporter permease [Actinobacteria bacterium RBG_19FT_COMBO_70_19]|nr:MAG: spermidine/putrescine ABC transporter permease [Actinobacteria bacterium RBG_19FT_COMBO_70_19]
MESRLARFLVKAGTIVTLLFLYVPIVVLVLYAFSKGIARRWPPELWTTKWFTAAWEDPDVQRAIVGSLQAAVGATLVALFLGSCAAFAVHRFRFFGRETVSFILVLPIALPGIVTAIALSSAVDAGNRLFGLQFSIWTVVIGHATFCVVVVFNNVVARLRRTPTSLVEASMDLGADGWQTFRYITLPAIKTALVAGGLLAFGLSFDEIVVTNFMAGNKLTLPIWIFSNIRQPRQQPVVNAVALVMMLLSVIPVYFAQRLTGGVEEARRTGTRRPPVAASAAAGTG